MQVTISLPEDQFITDTPEQAAAKIRLYAALGMYQAGVLSIGAACELAGVDRYSFHDILKREGIYLKTQSSHEVADDVERLRKAFDQ